MNADASQAWVSHEFVYRMAKHVFPGDLVWLDGRVMFVCDVFDVTRDHVSLDVSDGDVLTHFSLQGNDTVEVLECRTHA